MSDWIRKSANPKIVLVAVFAIVLVTPYLPAFFSPPVSPWTGDFYNAVQTIQPGDVVVFSPSTGLVEYSEEYNFLQSVLGSVWSRGARIIYMDPAAATVPISEQVRINTWGQDWKNNVDYGNRFVYLGVVDKPVAYVNFLRSPWTTMPYDNFRTPTITMPIATAFKDGSNAKIVINGLEGVSSLKPEYKYKWLQTGGAITQAGQSMSFYTSGLLDGIVAGNTGGLEYAKVSGVPAPLCAPYFNGYLLISFLAIGLIVWANIRERIAPTKRKGQIDWSGRAD
jgi:hypothetical protein